MLTTTGRRTWMLFIAVIMFLALGLGPPRAYAGLSLAQKKCLDGIGKAATGFVKGRLKLLQQCRAANLKDGSCTTPAVAEVTKLAAKLAAALDKSCAFDGLSTGNLAALGFPSSCTDPTGGDGFTVSDLKACIEASHTDIVDALLDLEYDPTVTGPLSPDDLRCQKEVGKHGGAFVVCILKKVQKCRSAIRNGKLFGVVPDACATSEAKTVAAIAKCQSKLDAGIAAKCSNAHTVSLKLCTPDQTDTVGAAACTIQSHTVLTDGPAIDIPADLIDIEYATRSPVCGDGIVNSLNEECEGNDDAACPGQCGAPEVPDGFFACLCKTKPRLRVVEHADADIDTGWTGISSDSNVPEGGGYVVDLYDCDGFGNCIAGPNCSLPPHAPCAVPKSAASGTTSNSICAALDQGTCRKERTATGPHCYVDIQKKCNPNLTLDPICDAPGDYCVKTLLHPPVAAAGGGLTLCDVMVSSEDAVGTVNLLTGTSSIRQRQNVRGHLLTVGSANKPCPVCGGFCARSRERCSVDADCASGQGPCVTASVCSDGPNQDRRCRRTPPFGGAIPLFGVTSVDCPPDPTTNVANNSLDVLIDPQTTDTSIVFPTVPCTAPGFAGNACVGGANEGRPCTAASECLPGNCSPQCFCAGQFRPNACAAACVGGGADAEPCVVDSECSGGFCHVADCRVNPLDTDSAQEGVCTAGPVDGTCSTSTFRGCTTDAECQPPQCAFCQPAETCVTQNRPCFVNGGVVRQGAPRLPGGISAGVFCVPKSGVSAIDSVAGYPGLGAVTYPELVIAVP